MKAPDKKDRAAEKKTGPEKKTDFWPEAARSTPITSRYQVAVAGGGIAGVSAALAAARMGVKTVLLEREWALGGLATLGLITIFLPVCDGRGHQVIGGIGEELIRLSLAHGMEPGHLPYPAPWLDPAGTVEERAKIRWQTQFNPNWYALEMEKLLLEAGVEIRYGTLVSDAAMEGGRIRGLIIQDKGGRSCILADAVVDCTGDADLCALAGAPTEVHAKGNTLAAWHYARTARGTKLKMVGCLDLPEGEGIRTRHGREPEPEQKSVYSGLDGAENSRMMVNAHALILQRAAQEREKDPDWELAAIPMIPQLRMTRRLMGKYTLDESEEGKCFEDSIGMTGDWRRHGPVFELPAGILSCDAVENLWAAGRCVSVTDAMWDITRVIPGCAVTGQAGGTAAALMALRGETGIASLQDALIRQGALLHREPLPG